MFFLGVLRVVHLGVAVGKSVFLIAKAAGPGDQGADGGAVVKNLHVRMEDVGVVKGEGFGDVVTV